jgi:hypothetical protein
MGIVWNERKGEVCARKLRLGDGRLPGGFSIRADDPYAVSMVFHFATIWSIVCRSGPRLPILTTIVFPGRGQLSQLALTGVSASLRDLFAL